MSDNHGIGALRFPSLADGWPTACREVLANDVEGAALAQSLVSRWAANNDSIRPPNLDPDPEFLLDNSWSELLGFAIGRADFSKMARANLVEGFRIAFTQFEPDLTKGQVWLDDCLALRQLTYNEADERVTLDAMELMLTALSKIPGCIPANDAENYARFHDIYHLTSTVLIAEPSEKKFIAASFRAGSRLLPASHATLFEHMILNNERGEARPQHEELVKSGFNRIENWKQAADDCRELIDQLFETLMDCNPSFSPERGFAPDAIFSHARELDVAWFRFAHRYSNMRAGNAVICELKKLRKNEDSLFAIDHSELKLGEANLLWIVIWQKSASFGAKLKATFNQKIDRASDEAEARQRQAA